MKTIRLVPGMIAFSLLGCASNDNPTITDPLPAAAAIDVATPEEAMLMATAEIRPDNVDAAFDQLVLELEGGK